MYTVSENSIKELLSRNGVTFANLKYKSEIPTAAKYKTVKIEKRTIANVQLFQSINDYDIYRKRVIASANTIVENGEIKEFEVSETWFEHDTPFSLIHHKKTGDAYLYFIVNSAKSVYFIDGKEVEKEEIKQYLTASEAKKIFENDGIVYNKKNDIYHTVQPRTLKLENIIELKANSDVMVI